jgi:hypothetical protein
MSAHKEREVPIISRMAAAMLVFGAAACGDGAGSPKMTEFRIKDAQFSVPSKVLRAARDGRAGFVRINDPDTPIEIVYDPQLQRKVDERGYPVLFSVNDGEYPNLVYRRAAAGTPVVCRVSAAPPSRKCGAPVEFKGSTWAVLFPEPRVAEAEIFRRRAESVLEGYSL